MVSENDKPHTKFKINKKHLQVKYVFYRIDIEQ